MLILAWIVQHDKKHENNGSIPKELMDEAIELAASQTKSQLIQEALVAQIARTKKRRLLTLKGTIDLNVDLDVLRDRRDAKA